jgi:Bacterial SH3 domain
VSFRRALLLVPILTAAPLIHAETQYVIEQLVVNVNSAPDSTGERVATIKSGEAVEVLDRQGDQVHVHLANGTEGWVRKSYLSAEEPLQHRLTQRSAEVDKLKQEVARLEGELASARATAGHERPGVVQTNTSGSAHATRAAATAVAAAASSAPTVNPAQSPASPPGSHGQVDPPSTGSVDSSADPAAGEPSYFMTPPEEPARPVWHWALGSFVVALALGFVLGWQVLDRRIRRKYGGLRIY